MRTLLATVAAAAALLGHVEAQCSTFGNTPPGTDLQLDDDAVRTVGLGFPFTYDSVTYTTITICSNGFVWLGDVSANDFAGLGADFFANETEFLEFGPRIAPCWDDWNPAAGGGVYFYTDGSSASVVWKGVPAFLSTTVFANMELVLTATHRIYLHFDASMTTPSTTNLVGLTAGNNAGANQLNWSTTLPSTIFGCTGYQVFPSSGFALHGQTIELLPTGATAIDHLAQTGTLATCTPGIYPPLASDVVPYGAGCPPPGVVNPRAIYEAFTTTAGANPTDMSGLSMTFAKSGTSYMTMPGPGLDTSYLTQGTPMTIADETVVALEVGAMTAFPFSSLNLGTIHVADNGFIDLQNDIGPDYTPTVAEFLGQNGEGARIAPHWTDYDMTFAGTFYWSNNDPGFCMATWENVEMYGQPGTSNTFQVKLASNGDITFSYGAVASAFDDVIVGITLGNGATAPVDDLSASIGSSVVRDLGAISVPVVQTASGRAAINTDLTLIADNVPAGTPVGLFVIGTTQDNTDLTGIGMTGCTLLVLFDLSFTQALTGQGAMMQTLTIPPIPAYLGVTLYSQAALFAPVNPFGIIASNGLSWTIGL